jgi:hypothetical protein
MDSMKAIASDTITHPSLIRARAGSGQSDNLIYLAALCLDSRIRQISVLHLYFFDMSPINTLAKSGCPTGYGLTAAGHWTLNSSFSISRPASSGDILPQLGNVPASLFKILLDGRMSHGTSSSARDCGLQQAQLDPTSTRATRYRPLVREICSPSSDTRPQSPDKAEGN